MRAGVWLWVLLQATFSVRTEMVVLPVTVRDGRGHSVAGLSAADFRVFDEGRPQAIALFRSGEIPVTLGLVVDHSQSMRPKLANVVISAAAFARAGHADDELFVVGFSDRVRRVPLSGGKPFTTDPVELKAALETEEPAGPTALYDAVAVALRHLPNGQSVRKALIVVTDGGDNASKISYKGVRNLARQSQSVIYGIGLVGAEFQEESPDKLKQLCRDSGGMAYFPKTSAEIDGAFAEIARDLREQYTIGFVPGTNVSKHIYHSIRVRAAGPTATNLRIRTRAGYIASGGR
jgi:VWFA-related protein